MRRREEEEEEREGGGIGATVCGFHQDLFPVWEVLYRPACPFVNYFEGADKLASRVASQKIQGGWNFILSVCLVFAFLNKFQVTNWKLC